MHADPKAITDGAVVAAAVSAPAWASWLGEINTVLTTCTLLIGLALGVGRLWVFLRKPHKSRSD